MKNIMRIANTVVLAAVMLAAACAGAWAGPQKPAALVLKVTGKATVQRANRRKAAEPRMGLQWGDRVSVSPGASVLVLFRNGKQLLIEKDTGITRAAADMDDATDAPMQIPSAIGGGLDDLDLYGGAGAGTRNYGGDLAGILDSATITAPRRTKILDTRPVFAWSVSEPGAVALLVLNDERGDEAWATATSALQAAYPEKGPALQAGAAYSVSLTAVINGHTYTDETEFYIYPEKQAQAIRAEADKLADQFKGRDDAFARHMVLASFYRDYELYADAVRELGILLRAEPANVAAWLELADMYHATGYGAGRDFALIKAAKLAQDNGNPFDF
jgi:hypothetical protein